jgi:hypothetical protein
MDIPLALTLQVSLLHKANALNNLILIFFRNITGLLTLFATHAIFKNVYITASLPPSYNNGEPR